MSKERFTRLVRDFCKTCGIADDNHIATSGNVVVHGVELSIVYSEKIDPLLVQIFCDMGECPTTNAADIYARLLQKNFYFKSVRGPAFTIDPTCGHLILIQECDIDTLTPEGLAQRLSYVADEANNWHYLPPDVPQLGGTPAPPAAASTHPGIRSARQRQHR